MSSHVIPLLFPLLLLRLKSIFCKQYHENGECTEGNPHEHCTEMITCSQMHLFYYMAHIFFVDYFIEIYRSNYV